MVPEADVFSVTKGSIHTTVSRVLLSWNIAESSGTLRGDVSQSGVSDRSMVSMECLGSREGQYALLNPIHRLF